MKHTTATIIVAMLAVLIAVAAIGVVAATTNRVEKDVRITARLLENGKVEFGLQERTDGGDWSETLLPSVNKFPYATATVDRWLFSSAVALTPVEFETVEELIATNPDPEDSTGSWIRFTGANVDGELTGYSLLGEASGDHDFAALYVRCSSSGDQDVFIGTDELLFNDNDTDRITLLYRIAGGAQQSASWWSDEDFDSSLFSLAPGSFATWLSFSATTSETLYVSASDRYDTFSASFTLTGLHAVLEALPCFSTPG